MTDLQQTKSRFKLIGRVSRINKNNAFREDVAHGKTFRSLTFGVKTSETNEIFVQMFSYKPEEVFLWNSTKAKEAKEKKKSYKGKRIPYEEWLEREEELREEGYTPLQTRIGLHTNDEGKIESHGQPTYVAAKMLYEELNNGDVVLVEGEIRYSSYTNNQGKTVEQKTYNIQKVLRLNDYNFDENEEVSYFEQQMVFVDAHNDIKEKRVYVTGRIINYDLSWHDTQFIVDYSDGDEDMKKLSTAFLKKFKFGDVINVYGEALNRAVVEEKEDGESEEDLLASLGGKSKPKHAQTMTNYIKELRIFGVDAWDKKVYKEDDFPVNNNDNLLDDSDDDDNDDEELFGKAKKNKHNPFLDDEDEEDEDGISEDDLPF